jgi:cobalamin synthase
MVTSNSSRPPLQILKSWQFTIISQPHWTLFKLSLYIVVNDYVYFKWLTKSNSLLQAIISSIPCRRQTALFSVCLREHQALKMYLGVKVYFHPVLISVGRAVAQAVSLWLLTAAARVRVRAACGFCGGQSGTGAGFLRVHRFPLPIIPPISPSS